MTTNKNKLCLGVALATVTMAAALVSPQAAAHKAKHKAAPHAAAHAHAYAAPSKTDILESQVRVMQDEIASLRAQVGSNAPVVAADAQKVQELDARIATVESKETKHKAHDKDNMVFFRGGYANASQARGGANGSVTNSGAVQAAGDILASGSKASDDAWYFGAGFDWGINNDLFGLAPNTQLLAELNVEYKQYGTRTSSVLTGQSVTINQLNLSASPKIKFLKGSAFRPWLIPIGFDLNIISPPSGAVTVMNPGLVFGGGADYKLWKEVYVGTDVRYHYTTGKLDGVNTDGFTAGGYVGLGF